MNKTIKAIVFDGEGTLFYGLAKPVAIRTELLKYGVCRKVEDIAWAFETARKIIARVKGKQKNNRKQLYLAETSIWLYLLDAYSYKLAKTVNDDWPDICEKRVYSDARACLIKLKKRYKLGFLTAGSTRTYNKLLRETRLYKLFSVVVGEDSIGYSKPHPKAYYTVLKRLKVRPEEAVMIGNDLKNDYLGPKKINMNAILIDRRRKNESNIQKINKLGQLTKKIASFRMN